jgi:hypothetical protein
MAAQMAGKMVGMSVVTMESMMVVTTAALRDAMMV